jgi:hypothetical protein
MRAVHHQTIGRFIIGNQVREDTGKHTHAGPTREPVVQGLVRPIDLRSIPPSQAVADHMDNSADNAPIVNTRHAMRQREIGFDAFELGFSEPKIIRHGQVLPPTLKRKIEPKGEITMRKVFAINYVTHDGVMQSPGAYQ